MRSLYKRIQLLLAYLLVCIGIYIVFTHKSIADKHQLKQVVTPFPTQQKNRLSQKQTSEGQPHNRDTDVPTTGSEQHRNSIPTITPGAQEEKNRIEETNEEEMTVVVVVCKDYRKHWLNVKGNLTRQKIQFFTLVKSVTIFSTRPTHYILVTDSVDTYNQMLQFLFASEHEVYKQDWPDEFRKKIRLSRRKVLYPPEMEKIKYRYLACTTAKLFLGMVFPDIDAAVVLDSDFLFLRPLEHLWDEFKNFDENQIYGFAPSHAFYASKRNKLPYYGETGINGGLIMVNFTRMKPVSQSIISNYIEIYEEYKTELKLGNQGIFNIFCAQHPELVYDVTCDWNIQTHFCNSNEKYPCTEAKQGISAFHANGGLAIQDVDYKISAMFDVIRKVDLTREDLKQLPDKILTAFQKVETEKLPDRCANISSYNDMVTNYMIDFFHFY